MRDPGILDPRHFFSPGTFTRFTRFLHDLRDFYMILCDFYTILRDFCDFYTILRDFYAILRDFYTILRDFCDYYAIFCQAKNLASQAPKTIMQVWFWGSPYSTLQQSRPSTIETLLWILSYITCWL